MLFQKDIKRKGSLSSTAYCTLVTLKIKIFRGADSKVAKLVFNNIYNIYKERDFVASCHNNNISLVAWICTLYSSYICNVIHFHCKLGFVLGSVAVNSIGDVGQFFHYFDKNRKKGLIK